MAKLDGTFKIPTTTSGAATVEQTELQQSIFNAPLPGTATEKPTAPAAGQAAKNAEDENRGQKRTRDEEEEESEEDVAMEEDSDDE